MSDTSKFREYVTSGAFKLTLSRQQVSALSMIAEIGDVNCGGHTFGALYNKGLITHIRSDCGNLEYRLTEAGVFALKLVRLADLVQGAPDPVAEELSALRSQLDKARKHAQQLAADLWDMDARVRAADQAVSEAKAWVCGSPMPGRPLVKMKNRHPERTQAEMMGHLQVVENFLQTEAPE